VSKVTNITAVPILVEAKTISCVPEHVPLRHVYHLTGLWEDKSKEESALHGKMLQPKFHPVRLVSNDGNKEGGTGILCAP
jgi:hypothetical protein